MYKPDFEQLDKLTEEGFLRKVISPCNRLMLYNYTDKCTYDRKWNKHTLNSRGTVYEIETGKVVARAFPKFFNFGELAMSKQRNILKKTDFEVYEKMDGSLGIIYFYDGEWHINTRGSFTSDQAIKGKEILSKYNTKLLDPSITMLVEIIYPDNRIIVDYGDKEELVVLGAYSGIDKVEINATKNPGIAATGMRVAPSVKFETIKELQDHLTTLDHTEEGYVVRLASGERVKFKSAEYLALARIMSNMSPLTFWNKMENGKIDRDFLQQLPEEFRDECDQIADKLEEQFNSVLCDAESDYQQAIREIAKYEPENFRKELGLYIQKNKPKHSAYFFSRFLGNKELFVEYVRNYIKPVGNVFKEI